MYNHTQIEEKWLQYWEQSKLFLQTETQEVADLKDKLYLLFAFAYPSGSGLHVGHVESKTALDIVARYSRMQGKKVFFPVGWDAFGLPAENYAIKTSIPPVETTKNAIHTFRRQIKRLGISYDWANEIATCHPGYYQWTQWLFLQLYQAGLAYQDTGMVNWCPSCQTVLANEQVVNGSCERCDAQVTQKKMKQWFFRITDYKDELIEGLEQVDWPTPTKIQQLNWIGKRQGAEVDFVVQTTASALEKSLVPNSGYALESTFKLIKKVLQRWYFEFLAEKFVFSPILNEQIWFTRSLLNHLLEEKTRNSAELLFRFFALPKVFQVLCSKEALVRMQRKKVAEGEILFWSFEECIENVSTKVVVRKLPGGKKHVYSVIWKGENQEKFAKRREKWVAKQKKDAKQHLFSGKKLSHTCGENPRCRQGVDTLQLLNADYTSALEVLSSLFDEIPLNPELNEDFTARLEKLNFELTQLTNQVKISCFTTRPDTVFGVTYVVISPEKFKELKLIKQVAPKQQKIVEKYLEKAAHKTEEERQIGEKDKTGVDTGLKVLNPVNNEAVSLFVADYVLGGYGTGAVMGVPAHDERDFKFAKKHGLKIRQVVTWADEGIVKRLDYDEAKWRNEYADYGQLINSGRFSGVSSEAALAALVQEYAYAMRPQTTYKLRDWLISRQRYWGAPIPIIYDPEGQPHPVKAAHLPWELPTDVDFKPTGESPLRSSQEFQTRTQAYAAAEFAELITAKGWDKTGQGWTPEYDTMDTFVDSSWYYLRYVAARNETAFSDKAQLAKWLPVDFYMIGPEHIVLHLLYARFFTKFLRDQGYLKFDEPFLKMRHQGMILGPDGKKMSKSKGNVINPDEVIEKFGADTLRVYEMFMGPIEADKPWDVGAVAGSYRFLKRIYQLVQTWSRVSNDLGKTTKQQQSNEQELVKKSHNEQQQAGNSPDQNQQKQTQPDLLQKLQQTIKKVSHDIPALKFNTAIAAMMELVNTWGVAITTAGHSSVMSQEDMIAFVKILAPFAPFLAEELYQEVTRGQNSLTKFSQEIKETPAQQSLVAQDKQNAEKNILSGDKEPQAQGKQVLEKSTILDNKEPQTQALVSIHLETWPVWDEKLALEQEISIAVQVNGKVRGEVVVAQTQLKDEKTVLRMAKALPTLAKYLVGKKILKEIYVPGKIVSLVVE